MYFLYVNLKLIISYTNKKNAFNIYLKSRKRDVLREWRQRRHVPRDSVTSALRCVARVAGGWTIDDNTNTQSGDFTDAVTIISHNWE